MKLSNKEIMKIALQQSAIDCNCNVEDFSANDNRVVIMNRNSSGRRDLKLSQYSFLTSFGSNIVASVAPEYSEVVREYINKYSIEQCFEAPYIYELNQKLMKHDMGVGYMSQYFLPDMHCIEEVECPFDIQVLGPKRFQNLYLPIWGNALCMERRHLDMVAVAAYDKGKIIGLAGASADCELMWQIGVDVLPEYRRQRIAAALTSRLVAEVIKHDRIPFYCCAWSNVKSAKNAIRSGFRPAWVQMSIMTQDEIQRDIASSKE